MTKKTRLLGIDLCRGLAAYAVILVHSGDDTWGVPVSYWAEKLRYSFYFAVPFFLAASFYFLTKKSIFNITFSFWQNRFSRIVVPYIIWSFIYIFLKSILLLNNQTDEIISLFKDPVSIIFLGAASYHLYFLPLLFTGGVLIFLARYLKQKQITTKMMLLLLGLSIVIYHFILVSGNAFSLGSYIAFPHLLDLISFYGFNRELTRLILVAVDWLLRCLPYLLLSLIINQTLSKVSQRSLYSKFTVALFFAIFVFGNLIRQNFLPTGVGDLVVAYSLLLLGISCSNYIKDNSMIVNLGLCSFGIYLIHPFTNSIVEVFLLKILPQLTNSVSVASMLIYSGLSFIMSWAVINILLKNKLLSKYMFGI